MAEVSQIPLLSQAILYLTTMGTSCCLSISALYLLVVCSLGHYARSIVDFMIERPGLVRSLLMEIITTVEWCACTFELIIVGDVYDKSMASIIMFCLLVWSAMTWGEATASPFLAVEAFIGGYLDFVTATLVIAAQIIGSAIAPVYVDWMWQLQHHCVTHAIRSTNVCESAIKGHPISGLLTGLAVLGRRIVVRHTHVYHVRYGYVLNAFVATACYFVLQRCTGGHTNPVVITSLVFACKETWGSNHVFIHWTGALAGCLTATYLNRYISDPRNPVRMYRPSDE